MKQTMERHPEYSDDELIEKYFEADLSPDEQQELQFRMLSEEFVNKINYQHAFSDAVATIMHGGRRDGNLSKEIVDNNGKTISINHKKWAIPVGASVAAALALIVGYFLLFENVEYQGTPKNVADWQVRDYYFNRTATQVEQHAETFYMPAVGESFVADYGLSAIKYELAPEQQAYVFRDWSEEIPCRIYFRGHTCFRIEQVDGGDYKSNDIYSEGTYKYFVTKVEMDDGKKMMTVTFNQDMQGKWQLYVDRTHMVANLVFQRP
jgi:hypothetical protein